MITVSIIPSERKVFKRRAIYKQAILGTVLIIGFSWSVVGVCDIITIGLPNKLPFHCPITAPKPDNSLLR